MIYTHKFIRLYYTETEVPVKFGAPKPDRGKSPGKSGMPFTYFLYDA